MKNLDDEMTEELIKLKFSKFVTIVSVKIMRRDDGSSQFWVCQFSKSR
jgi:polyadenylate-binding protein